MNANCGSEDSRSNDQAHVVAWSPLRNTAQPIGDDRWTTISRAVLYLQVPGQGCANHHAIQASWCGHVSHSNGFCDARPVLSSGDVDPFSFHSYRGTSFRWSCSFFPDRLEQGECEEGRVSLCTNPKDGTRSVVDCKSQQTTHLRRRTTSNRKREAAARFRFHVP